MKLVILIAIFFTQITFAQNPPPTATPAMGTPSVQANPSGNGAVDSATSGKAGPDSTPTIGTSEDSIYDMAPQVEYIYDPTGKKDPFKPYKAPRVRGDNRPTAPVDPLSTVDVSQLRLIAVLWNTSKPRAVVKDSQNRSFILFKNMKIGRNDGVVVDIREGEIVIVEKFDDGFGNTVREAKILEMSGPETTTTATETGG